MKILNFPSIFAIFLDQHPNTNFLLKFHRSTIEIDSESEEFEDAEGFDDDIFVDNPAPVRNRIEHLSKFSMTFENPF